MPASAGPAPPWRLSMGTSTRSPRPWSSAIRCASRPLASGRAVTVVSAMASSVVVCRGARACLMRYERSPSLINLGNRPGQALARFAWPGTPARLGDPPYHSSQAPDPGKPGAKATASDDKRGSGVTVGPGRPSARGLLSADPLEGLRKSLLVAVAAQLRTGPQPAAGQVDLGRVEAV